MTAAPDADRANFDSLGRGTAYVVIGTLVLLLLGFVGRVAVARHLSLGQFGDFNLGLALAGLLSLVALLGLHQAVARTVAAERDPAVRRHVIRWSATWTITMAVVSSTAVFLLASPLAHLFHSGDPAGLTLVFRVFSITIGLSLLCQFVASVFQGFEDTIPYAILYQGIQPAAFLVLVYALFLFHLTLAGAVVAWAASYSVTLGALAVYARRHLARHLPRVPPARKLPSGLLMLAIALWGVSTLTFVTGYADTVILGLFRPETQVGTYSAVLTLGRLTLVATGAVVFIFLPVTARLARDRNYDAIRSSFVTTARWALLLTVPLFLVFVLLPEDSLTAIYGAAYAGGGGSPALIIVTLSALISVVFGPVSATLAGMGLGRPLLAATAISAVTNVTISLLFIPSAGLMGAAAAWSVARIAYPAAGLAVLQTRHGIGPWRRNLLLPLALSLAIGIPVFAVVASLPHPSWIVFPMYFVGVLVFLLCVFVTRSVEEGDLVIVRIAERVLGQPLPAVERFLQRFLAVGPIGGHR